MSSSTSNISSSTLVSWASSLESSNNDSNSFDSSISSSTSDLPISSSSSEISSSSSSSSISSSSSSSISDSSSSTTQGIRPVEDKDDDSRLITTKTLVKLAVPEYVGEVVKAYRQAIDYYFDQKNYTPDILQMKKVFNRGFTQGFLFQDYLNLAQDIPGNQASKLVK